MAAARLRSNRSRMMARPTTMPADAPSACSTRAKIRLSTVDDHDGEHAGDRGEREAREQHRPPAEAVGQRPHQQLAGRERQQIDRDGELDGGDVGREPVGHHRQRRHHDVERGRADGGHRHQQQQQTPGRSLRSEDGRAVAGGGVVQDLQRSSWPSGRVAAASQAPVVGVDQRHQRGGDLGVIDLDPGELVVASASTARSAAGRSAPASASRTR